MRARVAGAVACLAARSFPWILRSGPLLVGLAGRFLSLWEQVRELMGGDSVLSSSHASGDGDFWRATRRERRIGVAVIVWEREGEGEERSSQVCGVFP